MREARAACAAERVAAVLQRTLQDDRSGGLGEREVSRPGSGTADGGWGRRAL